jgi:glycosyltransferase involved in cell wall biosynthesis
MSRIHAARRRPAVAYSFRGLSDRRLGSVKVCMLTYEFPHSLEEAIVSGEVKNPYHLAQGLARRGHEVTVLSVPFLTRSVSTAKLRPGSSPPVFDIPDGRSRAILRYIWRVNNVEHSIGTALPAQDFDVIHAHAPALALAAIRARRHRILNPSTPIVVTAHGTDLPEANADRRAGSLRHRLREVNARLTRWVDRRAFLESDVVIAVSQFQMAEMVEVYGVRRSKLVVIYNGIDRGLYRASGSPSNVPAMTAVAGAPILLFVGRLVPKKGLQYLIAAMPAISEAIPAIRCVVVGGTAVFDTYGAALRQMVKQQELDERFVWLSGVPEASLPAIYRAASVCVIPSVNYESLPTVALEAMACGIPVVATNRWGTPEALGPDHPGLVPEADPGALAQRVIGFLAQPELAERVRREQFDRLWAFSLAATVTKHEDLYERVRAAN